MENTRRAIYAGSFDPLTYGHLNIIERASRLFDELVVAVAKNTSKSGVFSPEEREAMIREATPDLKNLTIDSFSGLLVEYARSVDAGILVRGLRSVKDFEYEFQMALTNKQLSGDIDTVFLVTEGRYAHVASSLIREIVTMGGSVEGMVPPHVEEQLRERLAPNSI